MANLKLSVYCMLGMVRQGSKNRAGFTCRGLNGNKPAALTTIEISDIVQSSHSLIHCFHCNITENHKHAKLGKKTGNACLY